tara:strand:+ start:999 stop:1247 length:249 start_codon:yes stop_codon:yes gene_type:complete
MHTAILRRIPISCNRVSRLFILPLGFTYPKLRHIKSHTVLEQVSLSLETALGMLLEDSVTFMARGSNRELQELQASSLQEGE